MKTVLITGATGGIGQALVKLFHQNGYNVVINYLNNIQAAEELKEFGFPVRADVSDMDQVENMFSLAREKFQKIDVVINNSGIQHIGMLYDTACADWDKVISTDLTGTFNVTKCALRDMMWQGGKIINISSIWGQTGASCEAAYSAAKAGVIGLTKALAKEYSNINVNCICPGVIETKMNARLNADERQQLIDEIPLKRFGTPWEVAETALFLAEKGTYITGQVIAVNGGMYI
jgi:3-oxoacyl-[acyl-carrier protein] reductase